MCVCVCVCIYIYIYIYIYTVENYSIVKKEQNNICSNMDAWMDLKIIMLSEESQTEKNKYHMILPIHGT